MVIQQVQTLGNSAADSWVTSYMLCKTFFMNTITNKIVLQSRYVILLLTCGNKYNFISFLKYK